MSNLDTLNELKAELSEKQYKVITGFDEIDKSIGGFRAGQTYVIAGLKKSGKSSILMNFISYMLKSNIKVGYLNTELSKQQYFERLSALSQNLPLSEVESDSTFPINYCTSVADSLYYAEKKDVKNNYGMCISKTIELLKGWVIAGVRVVVVDNLTTFSTNLTSGKKGWEVLSNALDTLIDFAKDNSVIMFIVIHTKDQLIFTETPAGIQKLFKDGELDTIFDKSITVNRRPTSADIFGGGSAKSQISGGILLIWRPYQDFALPEYQRMTLLIMEDFRNGVTRNEIRLDFDGSKLKFTECKTPEEIFNG